VSLLLLLALQAQNGHLRSNQVMLNTLNMGHADGVLAHLHEMQLHELPVSTVLEYLNR
jgi:hypothetical protein